MVPLSELGIAEPSSGLKFPLSGNEPSKLLNSARTKMATQQITYLHIYEDADFSLGIFILPSGSRIPLHNHPGMTVFSRVLYGSMHVRSFDWIDPSQPQQGAVLVHDRAFHSEDGPTTLFPTAGGNIHQFDAITQCAVLDLLSPPYATEDGRDCTYYRPIEDLQPSGRILLQEYEPEDDFQINIETYQGVPVIPGPKQTPEEIEIELINSREREVNSWCSPASGSPRSVTPPPETSGLGLSPDQSDTTNLACQFQRSHLDTRNNGRLASAMEGL